jgi:hypothetical protein
MRHESDEARLTDSKRILDRVSREADGGSLLMRASSALRGHITAKDGETEDRVEQWGIRIGRALALSVTIGLLIWLIAFVVYGA